jgi:hypothetical protein
MKPGPAHGRGLGALQVRAQTDDEGRFAFDAIPAGKLELHLPGDPRTRVAQNHAVEVPAGVREHDIGTVRLARRPAPPAPGGSSSR